MNKNGNKTSDTYVKWIETNEAGETWIFCKYVVDGEERVNGYKIKNP